MLTPSLSAFDVVDGARSRQPAFRPLWWYLFV